MDFLLSASLTLFAWSAGIPQVSGIIGFLFMHYIYTVFDVLTGGIAGDYCSNLQVPMIYSD